MNRSKSIAAVAVVIATTLALSACGTPPWEQPGALPGNTPTPTATRQITTVINELATGSTQHELTAGNITLTVDYYSDLTMDQWTADANKPLSFTMTADLANDEGQKVYLSQVTLVAAVTGPDGPLESPEASMDRSAVNPGYLVKAPYSYSQTFILPPIDPAATSVTLSIKYELLLQTTPTSAEFAKQTAADTLTIAIAQPAQ